MILNIVGQVFGFVGSLCLLLFGMNMLSDGIQKGAGSNLQKLLGKIAGNRFTAVLTGIGVTAIIQSSGATTVMVVSFVNAEMLTLRQAIGVIFGANIGTTVTAWIVSLFGFSFSIADAAIPLFGIGFLLKRLKRFKIHNFADCFMGFAILFMGLDLLQKTLTLSPESAEFLRRLTDFGIGGLLIGVFVGAFVTALIHSSSAMTAIVLTMAANNFLTWELSAAMILGSNIGSTIDAVMSSFGASINAKRTALVHVLFNVVGTVIVLCVFKPFLGLVDMVVPGTPADNITTHIAMLHTIFNVCSTLVFLPFVDQIAFLATKIISSSSKEDNSHYKFPAILPNSHVSADVYLFQIQKEISKMSAKIMEMFDIISNTLISVGKSPAEVDIEKSVSSVQQAEEYIDEMNEAITHFLQHVSRLPNANHDDRIHFYHLITITDSLESLSDENSSIMYTLKKYIESESFNFLSDQTKKICGYLESVRLFYERVCVNFTIGMTGEQKYEYEKLEDEIDRTKKSLKYESRKRIETGSDVKAELAYIDLVRKIEKAGDCIYTIVQAI
ncbi:Na/Pi cotransporter family protein [Treponema berlinense]|uniref:Na/Pi cotransporter family protein n=1 Tax=Treponema berlinense TaxID=225004 RepID=UPI0026EA74C3|nr:Na/Pi cotransporter family protein [Treponema berlinense]